MAATCQQGSGLAEQVKGSPGRHWPIEERGEHLEVFIIGHLTGLYLACVKQTHSQISRQQHQLNLRSLGYADHLAMQKAMKKPQAMAMKKAKADRKDRSTADDFEVDEAYKALEPILNVVKPPLDLSFLSYGKHKRSHGPDINGLNNYFTFLWTMISICPKGIPRFNTLKMLFVKIFDEFKHLMPKETKKNKRWTEQDHAHESANMAKNVLLKHCRDLALSISDRKRPIPLANVDRLVKRLAKQLEDLEKPKDHVDLSQLVPKDTVGNAVPIADKTEEAENFSDDDFDFEEKVKPELVIQKTAGGHTTLEYEPSTPSKCGDDRDEAMSINSSPFSTKSVASVDLEFTKPGEQKRNALATDEEDVAPPVTLRKRLRRKTTVPGASVRPLPKKSAKKNNKFQFAQATRKKNLCKLKPGEKVLVKTHTHTLTY